MAKTLPDGICRVAKTLHGGVCRVALCTLQGVCRVAQWLGGVCRVAFKTLPGRVAEWHGGVCRVALKTLHGGEDPSLHLLFSLQLIPEVATWRKHLSVGIRLFSGVKFVK